MKKISAVMLILATCISVVACGASKESRVQEKQNLENQEEESNVLLEKAKEDYETIKDYGIDEVGKADLSFIVKPETMKDHGDYYSIEATFMKPVLVDANLKIGDEVTFYIDDLQKTEVTVQYKEKGTLYDASTDMEYNYSPAKGEDKTELYRDSDDRVESPFYDGILLIRKDAVKGEYVINEYETVTIENIAAESGYFNGVVFDAEGYVTMLSFIGD